MKDAQASTTPTGQQPIVHNVSNGVAPAVRRGKRLAERVAGDDDEESELQQQAGGQRHQQRPTVLPQRRPVAFDAVNAVGAPLDLTHRRCQRDDRGEQTEPQRELAAGRPLVMGALRGLLHHVALVLAGQHACHGLDDDLPDLLLMQRARQPDDRNDRAG